MVWKKIAGKDKWVIDYTIIYERNSGERTRGNRSKRNKNTWEYMFKKVGEKGILY